jgi:hypothetical protein
VSVTIMTITARDFLQHERRGDIDAGRRVAAEVRAAMTSSGASWAESHGRLRAEAFKRARMSGEAFDCLSPQEQWKLAQRGADDPSLVASAERIPGDEVRWRKLGRLQWDKEQARTSETKRGER